MAHFAELDDNNKVLRVVVIDDEYEDDGSEWCASILGGRWIQASITNRIRKQYPYADYTYDPSADVFVEPQPFPSWSLDANHDWQPPVPQPDADGVWEWDEANQEWTR